MSDIWIVFAIIVVVIVLFIWDRLPVVAVCVGCAMALWATGVLTLNQSLAGFGDPATIFVASLFVVSAALEKTGITAWAGQILIRGAGASRTRLISLMMLFVGVLSALISVNGAVAALLPVVVVMAVRLRRPPSQLLMPLVFGAHSGSMLALTGTPVNVLVLEASLDAGRGGFNYFEFALVGVPLVIGGIVIAVLFGERLLPVRESKALPPDLSSHARTLVEQFRLTDDVHQLRVREESPLVGTDRAALDLSDRSGALADDDAGSRLGRGAAGRDRGRRHPPGARRGGRRGRARVRPRAQPARRPGSRADRGEPLQPLLRARRSGDPAPLAADRRAAFPGMVTPSGDLIVLAVQRQGQDLTRVPRSPPATRCCCKGPGRRSTIGSRRRKCWW